MNKVFGRYMAALYVKNTLFLLASLLSVIYLFETVELIRRASRVGDVPLSLILQMSLLKLPEVGQILFPFAILFAAMLTFWQLNRRQELIIARAAGLSVWQILAPVLTASILIGILQMSVINPAGALLIGKFDRLESEYLKRESNQIAVFKEGLWLRQNLDFDESDERESDGYVILHAKKIEEPDWLLRHVTALYFNTQDALLGRIDSGQAHLEPGRWLFKDVQVYEAGKAVRAEPVFALPTRLTLQDVQDSFAEPETMSFWHLPGYIQTLDETGFDTGNLRVHYQSLLAQPLLFAAMILLAASVSMRPPRLRGTLILLSSGIFIGFVVFFLSSFLQALGASGQIPVLLAAWSPALICALFGVSTVMNLEDG